MKNALAVRLAAVSAGLMLTGALYLGQAPEAHACGCFAPPDPTVPVVQAGEAIELVGSLFWALHFVVLGKYASKFESISFASGHFIISGFINFVIGLFVEDISILSALPLIGAIIYRATLSIGIGYTLQVWGQKHTPPTDAALILGLEAVFAVLAAWFALKQTLLPVQIIGCVIIFLAVLISQLKGWTSGKIEHDHLVEGR